MAWLKFGIPSFLLILIVGVFYWKQAVALYISYVAENVEVERDIAYGPNKRHKLDLYMPKGGDQGGPIAIFLYGGSWKNGDRKLYHFLGAAFASRGFTTVIPDYRLYPEVKFPGFVQDGANAYAWVWNKFVKNKSKPRPIYLIGHSAGAHIGALLSYNKSYLHDVNEEMSRPAGLIGISGPYAFNPVTWATTRKIFSTVKNHDDARPVTFVDSSAPRTLLFHGLEDNIVKLWNAEELSKALTKSEVQNKLEKLSGFGHVDILLTISRPFRSQAPMLETMVGFMKE